MIAESFGILLSVIDFPQTRRLVHSLKICKICRLTGLSVPNVGKISTAAGSRCPSQHDVIVFKVMQAVVHPFPRAFTEGEKEKLTVVKHPN